jgi:hypothetical protein
MASRNDTLQGTLTRMQRNCPHACVYTRVSVAACVRASSVNR